MLILNTHLSYSEFLLEKQIATLHDEIKIDLGLDTTKHAEERKSRHGKNDLISNKEIISTVKSALDEIAERQFKGQDRTGQKYWIYDKDNKHLNVIAQFKRDKNDVKVVVITIMRKEKFKGSSDTHKITI